MGDHPTRADTVQSSDGAAWIEEWAGGFYISRDDLGSSLVGPDCCAGCRSAFRALAAFDYKAVAEHLM
jgi:hypothetical protein